MPVFRIKNIVRHILYTCDRNDIIAVFIYTYYTSLLINHTAL